VLEARLKAAAVVYQTAGVIGLRSWVASQPPEVQNTMFVRLVTPADDAIPPIWAPEDWRAIADVPVWGGSLKVPYIRLPKNAERDYTLGQYEFRDGWVLQIGRTTNSREAILNPIRRSFLLIGGLTVVLGFLAGAFFAHRAMLPAPSFAPASSMPGSRSDSPTTSSTSWCASSTRCLIRIKP
jgi:hypothetical protein